MLERSAGESATSGDGHRQRTSATASQKGTDQTMNARLTLEQIDVPNPYPADWNAMTGDRRGRFCQHCQKTVHNLSAISRDEAERLLCQAAGSLCVRYAVATDGRVMTLDYPA